MAQGRKRIYNADSLSGALRAFETRHGMTTADFLRAYAASDPVPGVDPFTCHVWASFAADVDELRAREALPEPAAAWSVEEVVPA
jgi:hypothetical protein